MEVIRIILIKIIKMLLMFTLKVKWYFCKFRWSVVLKILGINTIVKDDKEKVYEFIFYKFHWSVIVVPINNIVEFKPL